MRNPASKRLDWNRINGYTKAQPFNKDNYPVINNNIDGTDLFEDLYTGYILNKRNIKPSKIDSVSNEKFAVW